ncbi:Uu.00g145850.m01.CDS01 [Anthostomella pinea]|uniref:Uu.00g145850.m01.CDS01 n=1 Tax=Anthostomella pinea TaxID=933095 RepID=A0AAI8YLX8_9PEZI|nr:Uu.00g145850.m01.CDS01 [Anthostomella pinea]
MRCPKFSPTHNGTWLDGKSTHHGGLAKIHRANSNVVIKIPDGIPAEYAAPMLCSGITAWSPLKTRRGTGKSVGVLGMGGIGRFALIWAKALGCDSVMAISRSSSKKNDCLTKLGADSFIAISDDEDWAAKHVGSLDLIISNHRLRHMPMKDLLGLLKVNGSFITVGASLDDLPDINTFSSYCAMLKIEAGFWGTFEEIGEMLEFAAANGVRPLVQVFDLEETNQVIAQQYAEMSRYKFVAKVQSSSEAWTSSSHG